MADHRGDIPPIVRRERRRGTALAVVAIAVLILLVLFFLVGDMFVEAVPEAEAEANMVVETGDGA